MKSEWIIEVSDIKKVQEIVHLQKDDKLVRERYKNNVKRPAPKFNKENFWESMINCLITTQQKSGPGSKVEGFAQMEPYPLIYSKCSNHTAPDKYIAGIVQKHGLRLGNNIGKYARKNLIWLETGGWSNISEIVSELRKTRKLENQDFRVAVSVERKAVNDVRDNLTGFGPKQSRNLLQDMGYTRFEIPIDSRIMKWINKEIDFPMRLSAGSMSCPAIYDWILDGIQKLCKESEILPCILDASIFSSFNR